MKRGLIKAIFVCVLATMIGSARAGDTGNELYAKLTSKDPREVLQAYAYLRGVLDAENYYVTSETLQSAIDERNLHPANPKAMSQSRFKYAHICFGNDKGNFGQVKDIVFKYLDEHPEKRHNQAVILIRSALLEDFACANNPVASQSK